MRNVVDDYFQEFAMTHKSWMRKPRFREIKPWYHHLIFGVPNVLLLTLLYTIGIESLGAKIGLTCFVEACFGVPIVVDMIRNHYAKAYNEVAKLFCDDDFRNAYYSLEDLTCMEVITSDD